MRILSRYFVLSYLTYYAAIVIVSMMVIAIIEMMLNFDHVIEYGAGLSGVATYLFLRLPSYYLPYLLPVGSYGAAFLCLGLPARALEILAAKSSGISPARIAAPVLAAAATFSLVALCLNETIVLDAAKRFNHRSGGELFESRGSFWYHRGNTVFSVEAADRDSQTLEGVAIYERDRAGRLVRSVHADKAHIEADRRWRLEGALFREFDRDQPEAAPRTEARETAWLELGSAGDRALLDADARSLSLRQLGKYIRAIDREGRDTTRFRSMWHARLSDPFSVILFAVLAVPLGVAVERTRSLAVAALQGIGLLAAYYALQTTVSVAGSGGIATAAAAPWVVLGLFGSLAAWRFARMAG